MGTGDAGDELGEDDRLAEAGTAEQAGLAAADERREQIDDLDACLEELGLRRQIGDRRRIAVDRPALRRVDRATVVDRLASEIEDAAEGFLADRHGERSAGVDAGAAADHAVGAAEGDAAHLAAAEMLLDFPDEVDGYPLRLMVDLDGVVDRRDRVLGELRVERRPDDLGDMTDLAAVLLCCRCHAS